MILGAADAQTTKLGDEPFWTKTVGDPSAIANVPAVQTGTAPPPRSTASSSDWVSTSTSSLTSGKPRGRGASSLRRERERPRCARPPSPTRAESPTTPHGS